MSGPKNSACFGSGDPIAEDSNWLKPRWKKLLADQIMEKFSYTLEEAK